MAYKEHVRPVLDFVGHSEPMHHLVRKTLHLAELNPRTLKLLTQLVSEDGKRFYDPRLTVNDRGVFYDNLLSLAGGWDKPAEAVLAAYALGFGGGKFGGTTAEGQPGNKVKTRQWIGNFFGRIVGKNFLGMNNKGVIETMVNVRKYRRIGPVREKIREARFPIIANIGLNDWASAEDAPRYFAYVVGVVAPYVEGVEIVPSCPNLNGPEEVHKLQEYKCLKETARRVDQVLDAIGEKITVDIKLGGDSTMKEIDGAIQVAVDHGYGLGAANTTTRGDIQEKYPKWWRNLPGGFSGDDDHYRRLCNEMVAYIYNETRGMKNPPPIRAVGGAINGPTTLEKVLAGSIIVEMNTGLRIEGLRVADKTLRWLASYMDQEGVGHISALVGQEAATYNTRYRFLR